MKEIESKIFSVNQSDIIIGCTLHTQAEIKNRYIWPQWIVTPHNKSSYFTFPSYRVSCLTQFFIDWLTVSLNFSSRSLSIYWVSCLTFFISLTLHNIWSHWITRATTTSRNRHTMDIIFKMTIYHWNVLVRCDMCEPCVIIWWESTSPTDSNPSATDCLSSLFKQDISWFIF